MQARGLRHETVNRSLAVSRALMVKFSVENYGVCMARARQRA